LKYPLLKPKPFNANTSTIYSNSNAVDDNYVSPPPPRARSSCSVSSSSSLTSLVESPTLDVKRTSTLRWKNAIKLIRNFIKAQQDSHEARFFIIIYYFFSVLRDLWWLLICICLVSMSENNKILLNCFSEFAIIFDICSAYGNVGLSLGVGCIEIAYDSPINTFTKLIFILVMFLGKHRSIPGSLDSAIDFKKFLKIPVDFDRLIDCKTRLRMVRNLFYILKCKKCKLKVNPLNPPSQKKLSSYTVNNNELIIPPSTLYSSSDPSLTFSTSSSEGDAIHSAQSLSLFIPPALMANTISVNKVGDGNNSNRYSQYSEYV
jgi:hypothetical protein